MRALVTGSAGFIGRHFHRRLLADGWEVTGIDVKPPAEGGNLIDVRDFARHAEGSFDLIVHCAATVGGRMVIDGEPLRVATNLELDSAITNWAVRTRQPRLIYFSSSAAYPVYLQRRGTHCPLREAAIDLDGKTIGAPDASYGLAKLIGEHLAAMAEAEGVRTHVFRPFSGYGEDQDLDYPFPSFAARARAREDPFEIWGDGEQTRDFIHVDDIVDAVLEAIRVDYPSPVNLGSGIPTSFNDLAELMMEAAGYNASIRYLADKPVGVHWRVADVSRMREFYTPKIALDEGIRRSLAG